MAAAIASVSFQPRPSHDSNWSAPGTPMAPDWWLSSWRTVVADLPAWPNSGQ